MRSDDSQITQSTNSAAFLEQDRGFIRLSIITQFYPPDFAATGQFIEELAQQLVQQEMNVQVFTGQPSYAFQATEAPRQEQVGRVKIQRSRITYLRRKLGRTISSVLFCVRAALHLLKSENRGDLVLFVSEPPYLQTLGVLLNSVFKMPYACLVYDLYPEVAVELGVVSESHWIVRFWNAVNRWVWQRSEAVIVPSETMKERIAARIPELSNKICVIHNWADPTWIRPIIKTENTFAQTHHLVDKFTVLYSGNMGRCHDMETILAAAKELHHDPVQFVFIGSGPKREPCVQKVKEMGLTNCHFLPYQDKALLPQSLTACDLSLVSIDVGMEGLVAPSKFYSALSSGRPVAVICEKHSYLRQLVAEANCGAAFENGDSKGLAGFIRYLLKDPQMHQQLGLAGHRYIQSNFTPQLISRQYLRILHRAVLKDTDLRQAIERQEFRIAYQAIINLTTGRIQGFEALLRWQHPQRGLIYPNDFLFASEETGLIIPIGWWLMNEVCRQLRQWQNQLNCNNLEISVNLSTRQFLQPDLIPQIDRILDSNNLKGSSLILEINETSLIADPAAATAILMQLQTRHIRVSIDGFGKGYTSLMYLNRFPINSIEIDRSLVNRLGVDEEATKLIGTLMNLTDEMGLTIGAEGIETAEQLRQLKSIGIQQGRGFYFSRPLDADVASTLLQQHQQFRITNEVPPTMEQDNGTTIDQDAPLVLIVDDEKIMRLLLRRAVEKEGYRSVEATSGEEALAMYQDLQPDMILLDASMPGIDGFECCHEIRKRASEVLRSSCMDDSTQDVPENLLTPCPVLIITALDDTESIDRAFEVGATDYMTKPVNWAVLRQRLHRLINRSY
jgi:EAL domain-containing protein (putative c-di-GMP-specific phosphodiesterase class I)/CheY-like chemotaxis protein/glycosyltransferase involved in cell wall biosynthesis